MRYATVWRSAPITLAACVSCLLATKPLSAETTWNYDFGSGTGSFTGGESTTFLPSPLFWLVASSVIVAHNIAPLYSPMEINNTN